MQTFCQILFRSFQSVLTRHLQQQQNLLRDRNLKNISSKNCFTCVSKLTVYNTVLPEQKTIQTKKQTKIIKAETNKQNTKCELEKELKTQLF